MLADSGENEEVRAAVKMISRFWVVENTEYGAVGGASRGVVSAGSLSRCVSVRSPSESSIILLSFKAR
jgi:hypothetical protein